MKIVVWCLTWLPLAAWCYWRMLPLSNQIVKLIGYDGMSAAQCDVHQTILRCYKRYDEARMCILAALAKNPGEVHIRGLLHIGLARIHQQNRDWVSVQIEVDKVIAEAPKAARENPQQATRIYRHCADLVDQIGGGRSSYRRWSSP